MRKLREALVVVVPLALLAVGAWMIYRPAAPLLLGALLWLDLYTKGGGRTP